MQPTHPQDRLHSYAIIRQTIAMLDSLGASASPEAVAAALQAEYGLPASLFRETLARWSGLPANECLALLAATYPARLLTARRAALRPAGESAPVCEIAAPDRHARGAGMTMRWMVSESPFGPALVMATRQGICAVGFTDDGGEEAAIADLHARWPAADYRHDPATVAPLAEAAFRPGGPPPPLHLIGAPFQLAVWKVLLRIAPGEVTTYSAIARAIGRPGANRAVGTAVGRNPVSLLVPCHRVLRTDGAPGGYHWGVLRKRAMLAWESAQRSLSAAA